MFLVPKRYGPTKAGSRVAFEQRAIGHLYPGISVLDVGSGRKPTVPLDQRPAECHYVGLDISAEELQTASPGDYSETWVSDITGSESRLIGRFDLILSFQALEHIKRLDLAFIQMHRYLKPGGVFLVQFSGRFAGYSILNQIVGHRIAKLLLKIAHGRKPESVFPAHYNQCWHSALCRLMASWDEFDVIPIFRGATYFVFTHKQLRWLYPITSGWYLAYERCSMLNPNLASHYIIEAVAASQVVEGTPQAATI